MALMTRYAETVQFRQAITDANRYSCHLSNTHGKQRPIFNFIGTVKLHGTNAAIGYRRGSGYWFQSRNRVITLAEDHAGFALHFDPLADEFFTDHVLPNCPIVRQHYELGDRIVIFGEWCGGTIQENVAICGLSTMFVIFKIKIVNQAKKTQAVADEDEQQSNRRTFWLDPKEWKNIKWHKHSVYNIYDFRTYTIEIDFNRPELSQNILTEITEQVEQQCPVGAYFNRIGVGEGVVWTEWANTRGNLTFKVKGREHLISNAQTLAPVRVTVVKNVGEFIQYACTENRMRQALDYMREQGVPIETKNADTFLKWLTEDIFKEEQDTMNASNINAKDVTRAITKKAQAWFTDSVTENRKTNGRQKRTGNK
jgi:hypothetical protein